MKKPIALLLFLVILISAFSILASADVIIQNNNGEDVNMTELFVARSFTSSKGTKINYRIFFPKNYDSQKKYPLILFLHGYGQRGNDNQSQLQLGICEPFKNPDSEIYNCIVIAPQCPDTDKWIDIPGEGWDRYCSYDSAKINESASTAAVVELVAKIRDEEAVDQNRMYVTGLSMGGFGTWDILVRHPLLFTAAMPLCGGADYRKASVIKEIPIWTFHGKKDTTVPCEGTERMVAALEKIDGNITYTPYPEGQHGIWVDVYAREDIFPWLLSQKFSDRFPDQYGETTEDPHPVEPDTPQPATPDTPQPTAPEQKKSSCKSTVEGIVPAVLTVSAAAFALHKKKKKDEQ